MEIDRSKVCPLLLRCFWKLNRGYPLTAYRETPKDIYPNQEVQIYTWRDATLKEIGGLLSDVVSAAREPGSILSFSIVYLDKNGNFDIKQVIFSLLIVRVFDFLYRLGEYLLLKQALMITRH